MKLALIHRRQGRGISIERLFGDLAASFSERADWTVKTYRAPFHGGRNLAALAGNIGWATSLRSDVYHITGSEHYLALGLPADATVITVHDCATLHRLKGVAAKVMQTLWYNWPLRRATNIVAVSEFTKRELRQFSPFVEDRVRVIHDCVSDFFFSRKTLPFRSSYARVLQVGTAPNKNLHRHVSALKGLPCHFRIIGRLSDTEKAVLRTSGIEWSAVADVSDAQLYQEYVSSDVLLFSSSYEGFGMPIAEAQAVGIPVITSNVCSMPEVAGGAALLVDPDNVGEIRGAVERLLTESSLREDLISAGFSNAERFRVARIAKEYTELYKELYA